jgi:hypothetical protein
VAVVTNTAFDMFQRGEKDLMSQILRRTGLTTYKEISNLLFVDQGLAHVDYDSQLDDPDGLDQAIYEEADWIGLLVYWDLTGLMGSMGPTAVPIVPPADPLKGKGRYTVNEMMRWGRDVLVELIAEVCVLKGLKKHTDMRIPGEDELTSGLTEMLITRHIPIWIVFACKIYMDIRYIMETEIGHGHKELVTSGGHMKSVLTNYLDFSKELSWKPNEVLKLSLDEMECWITDDCFNDGREGVRKRIHAPIDNLDPISTSAATLSYVVSWSSVPI